MQLISRHYLKLLLKQRDLNQNQLAAVADCSPQFVSHLIIGKRSRCSEPLAARIAEALEVPVEHLFLPEDSACPCSAGRAS